MRFENKKVVITGASPDFGLTLSILFARLGAELFLSARTLTKAKATARQVIEAVPCAKVTPFQVDVTKPDEIALFAQEVEARTAEVDILINNASFWLSGSILEVSDEQIVETINSTATGSILMTQKFLPLLQRSASPDILFINSTASLENNPRSVASEAFSAAKAAQSTFADRLRHRLMGQGIRVISNYPPNFDNPSALNEAQWDQPRSHTDHMSLTARHVFECIQFALSQDRVCSVDKIVLSNNSMLANDNNA
ncbi:short-chain dehydrogenase [Pseudoalteromonas rubra]|uniref:Short-chain dehydrogenase n=1 Tax=Pseudoalteromonas rubra TaxID=43658 RepID=A0A5S3WIM7_9GAMM|nr:SDR family oxidoreductase [Pseudoalteromonas rubra]TMP26467.1 short-chain dehydrogenase [Pseudoalteromonas rubra]TMP31086.1 short-chain dehydrogenase [Pseudoalteromonas rubra]